MAFCPTCRSEYRPDFDRCQDCDCDLVDSLPEDPAREGPPGELIHLYSTTFIEEAETLRIMLQDSGVHASIANQGGAMYAVGIPTPAAPLKIMIPMTDAERAKEILKDHLQNIQKPPGDTPFDKELEASRVVSRKAWVVVWLVPPAMTLALSPFLSMEHFLLSGSYLVGIGLIAWKLGRFRSRK